MAKERPDTTTTHTYVSKKGAFDQEKGGANLEDSKDHFAF